jgi:hypothetical protein
VIDISGLFQTGMCLSSVCPSLKQFFARVTVELVQHCLCKGCMVDLAI